MGVAIGCGCKEVYRYPHSTYSYNSRLTNLVRSFARDDDEVADQEGSGFMSNITFSIRPRTGSNLFEIDSI